MKMKWELCILLSQSKMKLLGCSWNFHVWNPKPLKTEFLVRRRYMIFLVWICLDLVYQLECLWHKKAIYVLWFSIFFIFSKFLCPFKYWSNPRFDQGLIKFKTWQWKGKHESFLSHSKMKVLEIFMFETQNPSSLHMFDFIRQSLGLGVDMIHDISGLNMSRPCLSTWMLTIWHKKAIYVLWFFIFFIFFWIFTPVWILVKS